MVERWGISFQTVSKLVSFAKHWCLVSWILAVQVQLLFHLNQICRTHDFFARIVYDEQICCKLVATSVQSWIKLGCCFRAAPSQAWACHGRPGQAGKGQHQPVRVQHFLLQLDTAPATLPPLTAFDKLFYLHCPQTITFFTNPNWSQGTFSQGFPMNHCRKALEAKLALQIRTWFRSRGRLC